MDTRRPDSPGETNELWPLAEAGDTAVLAALFDRHRRE